MGLRLLLVEDDDAIRVSLKLNLEDEGYEVVEAATGEAAIGVLNDGELFDIVLVDLLLPGLHGLEVIPRVRFDNTTTAVLVVTAQADTHDVVAAGLEAGADDYLVKPIAPKELAARIRAVLRRVQSSPAPSSDPPSPAVTRSSPRKIEIRRAAGEVLVAGEVVRLTKTEFLLLWELASHAGSPVEGAAPRARLGHGLPGDSRLVDTHIYRLRSKVESTPPRRGTSSRCGASATSSSCEPAGRGPA